MNTAIDIGVKIFSGIFATAVWVGYMWFALFVDSDLYEVKLKPSTLFIIFIILTVPMIVLCFLYIMLIIC